MSFFPGWMRLSRRERLHGVQPGQHLVDVHRVQQRLVEAGLELLGHDQHLVVVAAEPLRRLRLGNAFIPGSVNSSPSSITFPENATSVRTSG